MEVDFLPPAADSLDKGLQCTAGKRVSLLFFNMSQENVVKKLSQTSGSQISADVLAYLFIYLFILLFNFFLGAFLSQIPVNRITDDENNSIKYRHKKIEQVYTERSPLHVSCVKENAKVCPWTMHRGS